MTCTRLFKADSFKNSNDEFYKNKQQIIKQELFFSEMLFEKDCAMSSLDYLTSEDSKLDLYDKNEKIKRINTNVFLVSSRSDYDNDSTRYYY